MQLHKPKLNANRWLLLRNSLRSILHGLIRVSGLVFIIWHLEGVKGQPSECSVGGTIDDVPPRSVSAKRENLTASFADSADLGSFTYLETYSTSPDETNCVLPTITLSQTIIAVEVNSSFTATPVVISQFPTVVVIAYPSLTKTMLATLGTIFERVVNMVFHSKL